MVRFQRALIPVYHCPCPSTRRGLLVCKYQIRMRETMDARTHRARCPDVAQGHFQRSGELADGVAVEAEDVVY
jgi:hypothetical protein